MNSPSFYQKPDSLAKELSEYLNSWGLRRFSDETSYYQWQREVLTGKDIAELNRLGSARRGGDHPEIDIRFYDLAAQPSILPVLYSQRYDFFMEIGCAITERIGAAHRVLDFGCGVGILTTFYALKFPHTTFIGIDRSPSSIARAREHAAGRGLSNVQYECRHLPNEDLSDSFDLIISTQTLFQAEMEAGLPSSGWNTYQRTDDSTLLAQAEIRTGLRDRLNCLSSMLLRGGRMLLCEKVWHLGRRILLQRALASRQYRLVGEPVFFRYQSTEELVQDGPLLEVSQDASTKGWPWNEEVTLEPGESLYTYEGTTAEEFFANMQESEVIKRIPIGGSPHGSSTVTLGRWKECLAYGFVQNQTGFRGVVIGSLEDEYIIHQFFRGTQQWTEEEKAHILSQLWPHSESQEHKTELPTYENHTAMAQNIWNALPDRHLRDQATFREKDGREKHIEWGTCDPLIFLYWANTFDQRQLVLMTPNRAKVLQDYYQESVADIKR